MNNEQEKYGFDDDIQNIQREKSDLSKVTELLFNSKWFRRKTILKPRLISALATLDTISKIWDVQFLKNWIPTYAEYLTSTEGRARQDVVDITKFRIDQDNKHQERIMELMGRR